MSNFANSLFAAVYQQKEKLETLTRFEDVLKNAEERFLEICGFNQWYGKEVDVHLPDYVARAAKGWLRVLEEDSFQPMCSDPGQERMYTILIGVNATKELFEWNRSNALLGRPEASEFLADYPYILNGRDTINSEISYSISASFIMTGLVTKHYIDTLTPLGLVGMDAAMSNFNKLG